MLRMIFLFIIQTFCHWSVKIGRGHGFGAYEVACKSAVDDDIDAAAHDEKYLHGNETEEQFPGYPFIVAFDHVSPFNINTVF